MQGTVATGDQVHASNLRNVRWASVRFTIFAGFGGILIGYDTGIISGVQAMQNWLCTFGKVISSTGQCAIASSQQSLVVATLPAGGFFGALSVGPSGDVLGRRWSLLLGLIIFAIGVIMQVAATALPLFLVGRFFSGWGVGMGVTLIPIYQSECSPRWIRGAVVTGFELAMSIGILIAALVNNATKDRTSRASWQIPISIQFVWCLILAVGMILLPESPRWLIKKGRDKDAAHALTRLYSLPFDHPEIQAELDEIHISFQQEKEMGESSYLDCFRSSPNKVRFRTLTGIFIQIALQFTGINFVFWYGTVFFLNAGIQNPFIITVATSIIMVFMTPPGMWGVEKFGRRALLLVGAAGMAICQYLIAIVGVTTPKSNIAGQKVLIAFVCIWYALYTSTWGPVGFVITGEIFPLNLRAKAMSLAVASNWLLNFGIGYATPYLVNKQPGSAGLEVKVFFIWGTTCVGCFLFAYFCIPETKGLSLEQIDLLYQNTTPMHSVSYRRQLERDGVELTFRGAQDGEESSNKYEEKV